MSTDSDNQYSWRTVTDKKNTQFFNRDSFIPFASKKQTQKQKNLKTIICRNIISSGECCYGSKCMYAHKLDEQNIDGDRKFAYEILMSNEDLSGINLQKNHSLYKSLVGLTTICELCIQNKCTGGYNCKFGACLKKYHICKKDLDYGDCSVNCGKVHLTKRNLKPLQVETIKTSLTTLQGTLLSADFFKQFGEKVNNDDNDDNISDLSDCNSDIDPTDECNQSIFEQCVQTYN